jgi:hypothetical protein
LKSRLNQVVKQEARRAQCWISNNHKEAPIRIVNLEKVYEVEESFSWLTSCWKGKEKKLKGSKMRKAVDGLSLVVEENECFGLLGSNGAGKVSPPSFLPSFVVVVVVIVIVIVVLPLFVLPLLFLSLFFLDLLVLVVVLRLLIFLSCSSCSPSCLIQASKCSPFPLLFRQRRSQYSLVPKMQLEAKSLLVVLTSLPPLPQKTRPERFWEFAHNSTHFGIF